MKTIITTVGASLFENYMRSEVEEYFGIEGRESDYKNILQEYNTLKDQRNLAEEYDPNGTEEKKIKEAITSVWLKGITKNNKAWEFKEGINNYASAEIESILKILQHFSLKKEEVKVILISTDTTLSCLACDIIYETFIEHYNIDAYFNNNHDIISQLRIDHKGSFEEGVANFAERFFQIYNVNEATNNPYYKDSFLLNITGGYKGIIPLLTIFGQVNNIKVCYKFEDSNQLIVIPQMPLKFRTTDVFEHPQYLQSILDINKGNNKKADYDYSFYTEIANDFLIIENQKITLSLIGKFFLKRYESEQFLFYCPEAVFKSIESIPVIKKILTEEFHYAEQRSKHINPEPNGHKKVYKKAQNIQRIYYFEQSKNIYIYKVFNDHVAHENYFNNIQNKLTEEKKVQIIEKSILRSIKKSN